MARVVIENLTKIFKGSKSIQAVSNLNLTVEDGELLVLVGPSGCGKTTTLRLIAGLEAPTEGMISIDGRDVTKVPPKDRDVAMVFQHHALYPHMTVFENLAFGLKIRKHPKAEIEQRVRETARLLELNDCLDRRPDKLSGGQRQRVAVGRAIVRQPKVFLFDEPLSNLDGPMRAQMRRELAGLHTRLRATMIYVTHDQAEAMTLGDRIVVMRDGVVQQVARPMELYHRPANRFVAGFIGSPPMNFFCGAISQNGSGLYFEEEAASGGFRMPVDGAMAEQLARHAGKKVLLGMRPENITKESGSGKGLEVVVEAVEPLGAETHLFLRSAGHSFVARMPGDDQVARQKKISVSFDMTRAHFFDAETGEGFERKLKLELQTGDSATNSPAHFNPVKCS